MEPASDTIFLCSVLRVSVHTARTAQLRSQLSASRSRKSAHTFRKMVLVLETLSVFVGTKAMEMTKRDASQVPEGSLQGKRLSQ